MSNGWAFSVYNKGNYIKMDDKSVFDTTKRQTINPLVDETNKQIEPLLKIALNELEYEIPLYVRLYNQIRFYEKYGKLKSGFSVVSKETLADQFGVTVQQIDTAYSHLTNTYKLGQWVNHIKPIFRNVNRTWVSNARLGKLKKDIVHDSHNMIENSHSMRVKLSQHESSTLTACELPSGVPPLVESKYKLSESNNTTKVVLAKAPNLNINEMFSYWEKTTGLGITSKVQANRRACSNLLKRHGVAKLKRLIDGVAIAQGDTYAPRIANFVDLQSKRDTLLVWGRQRATVRNRIVEVT